MKLILKPVEASEEIMALLEEKGVITRLGPKKHTLSVNKGESRHASIYESDDKFGPHKIISVTINNQDFSKFLYHNDNEEFLLLDNLGTTPLYILFSLNQAQVLYDNIKKGQVVSEDFILVEMKKNDPLLSFFIMHKKYPHVELCKEISDCPPSFYVTESRDIDENIMDMGPYEFEIMEVI